MDFVIFLHLDNCFYLDTLLYFYKVEVSMFIKVNSYPQLL